MLVDGDGFLCDKFCGIYTKFIDECVYRRAIECSFCDHGF